MLDPLTVAACQPPVAVRDVCANVATHAEAVRRAGARLVAFPELSLTGYDLEADPVDVDDPALLPLVEACAGVGTVALVGAPVRTAAGVEHVATLRVDADGVGVAYLKTHLGGAEARRFAPGPGAAVTVVDGHRVALGICRDTGVAAHVRDVAAVGPDLYVAGLVHQPDELDEQRARAVRIARATGAPVVFASCAGPGGPSYPATAGHSGVHAADGTVLDEVDAEPGAIARATLAGLGRGAG
ncbi:carbon-nitrogen hydrolase family protein [Nocardioides aurantiacus]|uniref:carbon-nitrogen hydrolase family protein n=1 Tax=Nocardioides aurantiacus TaxID=86796 RepID=UPI000F479613|nr:carbon-nitrogen hydrolase family protein [Nocardioides aurantiacus]